MIGGVAARRFRSRASSLILASLTTVADCVRAAASRGVMVGSGSATRWEGVMAGALAAAVCGFGAWVLALPPLGAGGTLAMTAVIAGLGPLGPPSGSILLGGNDQRSRYVRRIDTLIVAGPIAAWLAVNLVWAA